MVFRRIRKYDAAGLMTQVADNGGIDYYYRPDGQPIVAVVKANQKKYRPVSTTISTVGALLSRPELPESGVQHTALPETYVKETDADSREIVKEYDCYGGE